ncbi:MAG: glycosyltransferase family 4 protein [Solirubrobacteraceae bacterium]
MHRRRPSPPIVLNARAASRPELGGVERYAREVISRLAALGPPYRAAAPPGALVHRAGHAWEQLVLPARAAQMQAGVIYSPANLAPVVWPRNVVVIHDAAPLRDPSWYSPSYVAWQRLVLPQIARRAAHVVTVSEFSRQEIVELLGVPAERVAVIGGGVSSAFRPRQEAGAVSRPPYVLCVASATARKNLRALEAAAERLSARGIELVVAGGGRPQFVAERASAGVRLLGAVPDVELPALYAGARAFVLPSLYEGFGLPCLEAMACGTPVVAARRGALPEILGDAAVLADPLDERAFADALDAVVMDGALRDRLRAAGLARAARYTWERTAELTDELLRGALAGS